jgi:hypothetical protein
MGVAVLYLILHDLSHPYLPLDHCFPLHYNKQGIFQRPVATENKGYPLKIGYFLWYLAAETNWP